MPDRYAALAETQPETGPRLVGLRMLGLERFYEGRFAESLAVTNAGLAATTRSRIAISPIASAMTRAPQRPNYKAWNLWHLGLPDQADADHRGQSALDPPGRPCEHDRPRLVLRYHDSHLAAPAGPGRGAAREAIALAEEMTLPLWHAWGRIQLGWALSQGDAAEGLADMEAGIEEARHIGAGRFEPFHLGLLADAYLRSGRYPEAQTSLARAFEGLALGHHRAFAADLHRMRAAACLHTEWAKGAAAESDLRRAIDLARDQEAPALELRATRDLARLWSDLGERRQACDLLAPVYSRFTEGFATPDLIETRTVLDSLA